VYKWFYEWNVCNLLHFRSIFVKTEKKTECKLRQLSDVVYLLWVSLFNFLFANSCTNDEVFIYLLILKL